MANSSSSEFQDYEVMADSPSRNHYPTIIVVGQNMPHIAKVDEVQYRYISVVSANGPVTVEIFNSFPGHMTEIRYTTNGKIPTPKSRLYTGPLTFHTNTAGGHTPIKARVFSSINTNHKSKVIRLDLNVL